MEQAKKAKLKEKFFREMINAEEFELRRDPEEIWGWISEKLDEANRLASECPKPLNRRWEYLERNSYYTDADGWEIIADLNELGANGWEIINVGIVVNDWGKSFHYLFRREI